jgi:hypothetical protein
MNWYTVQSWMDDEAEEMMTFLEEELGKARDASEKVDGPPALRLFVILQCVYVHYR